MLPSRGIARLSPGLGLKSNVCCTLQPIRIKCSDLTRRIQILARVSVRSTSPHATSSARQFGTSLRSNGTILARARTAPLHPSSIVCAGILTSQSTLFSPARRRFASTDSTAPTAANGVPPAATDSEFSLNTNSFPELDDAALLDFPQQVGYLAQLGIDYGWGPTSILQWGLEHLHFTMGLPWWGSIVGLTIVTRLVLLWPVVKANEMSVRVREARKDPLYKATADKMLNSYSSGKPLSAIELQETRMQIAVLNQRMGIKSWMMFLPFIQIPFAFGGFRLMRAMAALPVPGLDTGGLLWISDLTVADPYFLMPLIATATMGASFKVSVFLFQHYLTRIPNCYRVRPPYFHYLLILPHTAGTSYDAKYRHAPMD